MKISSYVAGKLFPRVALFFCLVFSLTTYAGEMTIEQKVGQLMIWSFNGTEFSPEMQQTLTKYRPGAFIVFRHNVKSAMAIGRLIRDVQRVSQANKIPPVFMMVDQEGGLVTRVRTYTPMPSALALSKMDDPFFIERYGHASADLLQMLGFSVDLAPVLDISNPKLDSFIGNRTFGSDPESVARLTMAYAKGISSAGLIPTAKHFPGHGGTMQDSHHMTPQKMSTLDELQAHDLIPFVEFTGGEFPKAIMMAHMSLPNIDKSGLPATYSPLIIHDRLRQALAFDGLVITDDLEMNGASVSNDIGERAVRAFLAGNDMLMLAGLPSHQRQAFEAMVKAVRSGRISRARLDESLSRIAAAKSKLPAIPKLDDKKVLAAFQSLDALSKEVMKRNFKMAMTAAKHAWPEITPSSKALVFSNSYRFFKNFEGHFRGKSKSFIITPDSIDSARNALASTKADFAVFFASGSRTARWLNALDPQLKSKIVVVNCNHEGEIADQDRFLSVLNINSFFPESATWTAQLLNGPTNDVRSPAGDAGQ